MSNTSKYPYPPQGEGRVGGPSPKTHKISMPTPRGGGWVKNQKHKYPYPP